MCLQLWPPTTEGDASRSSDESLRSKYQIAMKTTSFENFCEEVRKTIDGNLSSSPSHLRNPLQQLLSPNEDFINTHVLQQYINKPDLQTLISQCFSKTQNAFELCARLLKNIHHARFNCRAIRDINIMLQSTDFDFREEDCCRIREEFRSFVERENPFGQSAEFNDICDSLDELNRLPELRAENKPRFSWVAEKQSPQIDGAARGIYVLKNHLKTARVLVSGLYDEVENTKTIMGICLAREDEIYPLQQVGKLLEKNDSGFGQRLDEIEEHSCLCLRNINRARMLLLQIRH